VSWLVITGVLAMVSVTGVDVAPAHVEFTTVIEAVPALAMRMAGTVAVSCVEETNVVASGVPFHFTIEVERKFVPITVNVNCGPPGVTQVGLIELIVGLVLIVIIRVALPVYMHGLVPLLALMVTFVVPAVVGVPEMTPVLLLIVRPAGSGLALKLVGLLVAVIV
jgi:hypothetical protein